MNICIITMGRINEAETIAKLLESISTNNLVTILFLKGIEDCLQGIECSRKVMACQQLVVIRRIDGTISRECEKLVDLAVETDSLIYYFD